MKYVAQSVTISRDAREGYLVTLIIRILWHVIIIAAIANSLFYFPVSWLVLQGSSLMQSLSKLSGSDIK